jgi:hypothetical protein
MLLALVGSCAVAPLDAAAQFIRVPLRPPAPDLPKREPPTLTPSVTVTEEFNDNVFLDNRRRRSDFITAVAPGLDFAGETPDFRFAGRYRLTAEFYDRHSELDNTTDRHAANLEFFYRLTPRVTLAAADEFNSGPDTPLVSPEGVSTGRGLAFHNSVVGALTWALDANTGLRFVGAHTLERFDGVDAVDSDVYRAQGSFERVVVGKLTGIADYEFALFDVRGDPQTQTHTPRLGMRYEIRQGLVARLSAGPTVALREDDTRVTPALTASLEQQLPGGLASVLYDRAVGTAGGLGGTTDNQLVSVRLLLPSLVEKLQFDVSGRYATFDSATGGTLEVRVASVALQATYRFTTWLSAMASYAWLRQRTRSGVGTHGEPLASEVDQNRILFGLEIGYPLHLKHAPLK